MADPQQLMQQARALGEAIAGHPAVKAYVESQLAVTRDAQARQILDQYRHAADEVRQREAEGQPIEPDHKRRLMNAERSLASHETLKTWMRAQTDYVHLMNLINQAMEGPVAKAMQAAGAQPAE